ncbi:MAG: hypothetical protein DBX61_06645 [Clostridiales bacterium]|nr:MAG: hypothetical protein DBX61_06645 [Clostridiales bacterium]
MRVLFVDIDTLRPDHMSCYGYCRQTTPNFDAVAKDGVRFDSYYINVIYIHIPYIPVYAVEFYNTYNLTKAVIYK